MFIFVWTAWAIICIILIAENFLL